MKFSHLLLIVAAMLATSAVADPAELTNAIYLAPPANFHVHLITNQYTDPGDDPLSVDGPELLSYIRYGPNGGQIVFQRGMVGVYIGDGKVVHFKRLTASRLKDELANACKQTSDDTVSVSVGSIDGYITAQASLSRSIGANPRFLHFCWVQIDGNEALKVTAFSNDTNTFAAIIDCLKTLTIDKHLYFDALNLKEATVSTNRLTKIEIGHVMHNGIAVACCVLYTEQKNYTFSVWSGIEGKELDAPKIYFKRLEDCSASSNSLGIVVIDLASQFQQSTINIEAETNAAETAAFRMGDIRSPAFQLGSPYISAILGFVENRIPEGFKEEAEYNVNATLFIRKQ